MDDAVRENYKETHPVGTVITITHSGRTDSGKPRFARYMRIRDDVVIKDKADEGSTEKIKLTSRFSEKFQNMRKGMDKSSKHHHTKVIEGLSRK